MLNRKSLLSFLAIAFALAWLLFLLPLAFGPPGSPTRQLATVVAWSAAMWAPGLAALLTTRFVERQPVASLNLRRLGPKRPYLWAWLLPPALAVAAGLTTLALRLGQLDPNFTLMRNAMAAAPGGAQVNPALIVAAQVGLALTLAPLFNTLLAVGEELGWRGFLLPRLLPLGQWRAILLSGAIWGVWHAPAILQGHNYPGYPIPGVAMMTVFTILMSVIFSWLYLRTNSPWAPALAHGALNASAGLPVLFLLPPVNLAFAGTVASVAGWVGLAVFDAWLVMSRRLPVGSAPPTAPAAVITPAE